MEVISKEGDKHKQRDRQTEEGKDKYKKVPKRTEKDRDKCIDWLIDSLFHYFVCSYFETTVPNYSIMLSLPLQHPDWLC